MRANIQWWHIDITTKKITKGIDSKKNSVAVNMRRLKWNTEYRQKIINRLQSVYYAMKGIVNKLPDYKCKARVEFTESVEPKAYGRCCLYHDRRKQEPTNITNNDNRIPKQIGIYIEHENRNVFVDIRDL